MAKTAQVELKVDECKPLGGGAAHQDRCAAHRQGHVLGRGLHSFTFQLNLSRS